MDIPFDLELAWAKRHMLRLGKALMSLPDMHDVRLAMSIHLDLKVIPLVEGLLERGAKLYLVTCNPTTVRDEVVAFLRREGVEVQAWLNMPEAAYRKAACDAIAWGPTHLCEFGADLTAAFLESANPPSIVRASLEGTGSGINRLAGVRLPYPIFNWDDLPVKEGLHNRHMVGLTTWQTFFARTRLSLHGKKVAVIGYGLVGQGVAASARAFGGTVLVVEVDPARALQAGFDGWPVVSLAEALPQADVIATATGAKGVLPAESFQFLKEGVFLVNVGHRADEIDLVGLDIYPHRSVIPYVDEYDLNGRSVFLFAGGAMANLTAGAGDSLNAFDLTLALMVAGIGHIVGAGAEQPPGVYLLPRAVWETVLL